MEVRGAVCCAVNNFVNLPRCVAIQDTIRHAKMQNGIGCNLGCVAYTLDGASGQGVAIVNEIHTTS